MRVSSLGDGVEFHLKGVNGERGVVSLAVTEQSKGSVLVEVHNILVFQVDDFLGMLHDRVHIRSLVND